MLQLHYKQKKELYKVQTFLPYPSFGLSVSCLDWRRLGKQRVEALQILNTLHGLSKGKGWSNHPAVKMWKGYENALSYYKNCCIVEWIRRGYNNTMKLETVEDYQLPEWFGREDFHASHRSNLLRKDSNHYGQFEWKETSELPYVWPTQKQN